MVRTCARSLVAESFRQVAAPWIHASHHHCTAPPCGPQRVTTSTSRARARFLLPSPSRDILSPHLFPPFFPAAANCDTLTSTGCPAQRFQDPHGRTVEGSSLWDSSPHVWRVGPLPSIKNDAFGRSHGWLRNMGRHQACFGPRGFSVWGRAFLQGEAHASRERTKGSRFIGLVFAPVCFPQRGVT